MGWHGPKGSCGCCVGNCTCPFDCNDCLDPETLELLGYVTEFELTISNFAAVYEYNNILGGNSKLRLFGFDQFNGTYRFSAFYPQQGVLNCDGGIFKRATITAVSESVTLTESGTIEFVMDHSAVFFNSNGSSAPPGIHLYQISATPGVPCQAVTPLAFAVSFRNFPIPSPCAVNAQQSEGLLFRSGLIENIFFQGQGCFNWSNIDFSLVSIEKKIYLSNSNSSPIIGWNYTVSNVPSSFYLRISNTVKSYLITGMDVINGDYELELDDETDCTKGGIEFLTFDITAQEYQVSLSSPCTIVPVVSQVAATARLALPPTSAGVVVTIRIPGENDKSILIDDWVPFGCDGYTEDAYIDHESTECFGNPDPILTLTQSPILG